MNQIAASSTSMSGASHHASSTSPLFVRLMICLTAVLALGMVSLVFYRSQSVVEPTSAVLVIGDPSLDGARVSVSDQNKEIANVTLSTDNNFTTPVLVQPGLYELQVALHGQVMLADRFNVRKFNYATFSLPTAILVEGDPSLAGETVEITNERGQKISAVLSAENNYAFMSYHSPGIYHLLVRRDAQTVRDDTFTLEAHKPRRVSLIARIHPPVWGDKNEAP